MKKMANIHNNIAKIRPKLIENFLFSKSFEFRFIFEDALSQMARISARNFTLQQ